MEAYLDALKEKLDEVSKDVKDLVKISTTHNVLLDEHQKRSVQLENLVLLKEKAMEERLRPLEDEFKIRSALKSKFVYISSALLSILSILAIILKFWK